MADWKPKSTRGSGFSASSRTTWKPKSSRKYSVSSSRSKDDGDYSVGGFFGNLLKGARDAVVGLGPGLYHAGRAMSDFTSYVASAGKDPIDAHTKQLGKALIDSYKNTYGRGWRGLYEDPFNVFLDATVVASVGSGAAVRAGLVPSKLVLRTGASAGKTGNLVKGVDYLEKELSRRPLRRVSQVAADKALKKTFKPTSKYGEYTRATKIAKQAVNREAAVNKKLFTKQMRLADEMIPDPKEKIAASARAMFSNDVDVFDFWVKNGGWFGQQLEKAGVRELFLNPTERMERGVTAMGKLGEGGKSLLRLTDETADARRFEMIRLARGGKFMEDLSDYAFLPDGTLIQLVKTADGALKVGKKGTTKGKLRYRIPERDPFNKTWRKTERGYFIEKWVDEADLRFLDSIDDLQHLPYHAKSASSVLVGGGTIPDLMKEFAGREPVYFPHVMPSSKGANLGRLSEGGAALPLKPAEMKQNLGILAGEGAIMANPRVTINSFARALVYRTRSEKFDSLVRISREVTPKEAIAIQASERGKWQVLNLKRNQKNPAMLRGAEEMGDWLDEIGELDKWLDDVGASKLHEAIGEFADDITAASIKANVTEKGNLLIVPKAAVKEMAGEFKRMGTFAYMLNKYPVRVWRAMVLNLRPAWLVNNMIGNTLMYLIDDASPRSLYALGQSIKANLRKGNRLDAQLFDEITVRGIQDIVDKWFGNIETFIGSQRPTGVARVLDRVPLGYKARRAAGLTADADRWWEATLREAKVRSILAKHPEVKKFTKELREGTVDYSKAIDSGFKNNPALADSVAKQVNEALGDFMSMSAMERTYLRTAFPFYAWFRAITGVTLKLPLNHPLKSNILGRLGQVGAELTIEELGLAGKHYPGFAVGMIPLGDTVYDSKGVPRVPILSTSATNPYATTSDLGEAVAALFSSNIGDVGRQLPGVNPYFSAPVQAITGRNLSTGQPVHDYWENRFGVFGNVPGSIVRNLPQFRVIESLLGTRYQGTRKTPTLYDQNLEQLLMRYFGYPRADVSTKRLENIP